jgi:hypothetical protein
MNIPVETKPALWGAAAGAVALAIAGFSWAGWTTGAKAETMAVTRSNDAVVAALAPVCVDRFEHASDAVANRAALVKLDSWTRGDYVEKGGWATFGTTSPSDRLAAVAKACADLLTKPAA